MLGAGTFKGQLLLQLSYILFWLALGLGNGSWAYHVLWLDMYYTTMHFLYKVDNLLDYTEVMSTFLYVVIV